MSPPKLIEHERTLHHQNKLIRKVEKLSKNIEERAEKKSKVSHIFVGNYKVIHYTPGFVECEFWSLLPVVGAL